MRRPRRPYAIRPTKSAAVGFGGEADLLLFADAPTVAEAPSRTDVLVCARPPLDATTLARLRCPVVLVA